MMNEFFQKVMCIYLERRKESWFNEKTQAWVPGRFQAAEQEFKKHGINVDFVSGVDGLTLDIDHFPLSSDNLPVTRGDIGCVLSHLKVVKMAKAEGLSNYFVFEDDAELDPDFQNKFRHYIQQMPRNWDMIYFGGNHMGGFDMVSENVAKIYETFTTHAIGVRETVYDSLIELFERQNEKIDICAATLHKRFNCYVFRPHLAFQRESYSDILERDANYVHLRN